MGSLSQLAVEIARAELGVHEEGGNNRGPRVEEYLRAVGLEPGNAWCAAFVFYVFREASKRAGLVNPCPRVGAAIRLWKLTEPICRDSTPTVGAIYVLDHGGGLGHAGIVTALDDTTPIELSGNTFATRGGRAGNCVAEHRGAPNVTHGGVLLGYLQLDRAAQPPPGLVT